EKGFGPSRQWSVRGEVRRGFGGHEGVLADASLSYRWRMGRTIARLGPRATVASSDFMQTYFGIDGGQALRAGLPRYNAGGGLLSYGLGGTLIRPLDRRSAITVFTSLERLGGSAADSPLIRQRGQRTQFTLGVGYGFRFGL
ncbi:MAG: MipA/OmpV family protein, partial [Sphingomonadales bacterium]